MVILKVEDDSRWREVVGGCNPYRRQAEKWLENTTVRGWLLLLLVEPWVERRRRKEERESVLNLLGAKQKFKRNKYLAKN